MYKSVFGGVNRDAASPRHDSHKRTIDWTEQDSELLWLVLWLGSQTALRSSKSYLAV
jgi:hypothetical protein